jgi:pilus assembly protein CpaF
LLVERMLVQGAHLVAVGPPAGKGWVLSIRKRRRIEATMEGLVRAGSLSRPIASFLDACVAGRLNVLVVGSSSGAVATAIAALASAVPASERVVVVHDVEDLVIDQTQVASLALPDHGAHGEESIRAASRLLPDRLVVTSLGGSVTAAVVEAVGGGAEGVVAGVHAPSIRRALGRLPSQIALARPGTSTDAAREALGECFDLAVEVVRLGDGRIRVQRVSELDMGDRGGGTTLTPRDIFVLQGEGSGESAFTATGAIPKVKDELASRGVRLDAALFRKR